VKVATLEELEAHEPVPFTLPSGVEGFVVDLLEPAVGGIGPAESIVAFSSICPHMGCPIDVGSSVDAERGRFGPCACHHSVFDLRRDGRMVHGRASTSLSRIELAIHGAEIWATTPPRLAFGQPLTSADALTRAPGAEDEG
jgi:arsenite oxidase small subunit